MRVPLLVFDCGGRNFEIVLQSGGVSDIIFWIKIGGIAACT